MHTIPLQAIPSQRFAIVLAGQNCVIALRWHQERLYCDLDAGGTAICRGSICQDRQDIVRARTPRFSGSLHFVDMEGRAAPRWDGLGARFVLLFAAADEDLPEGLRY